jgi:hypothetical protein
MPRPFLFLLLALLTRTASAWLPAAVSPRRSAATTTLLWQAAAPPDDDDQAEAASSTTQTNVTSAILLNDVSEEADEFRSYAAATSGGGRKGNTNSNKNDNLAFQSQADPALSFQKFMTMQGKRVVVTIRYSGEAGLKPYFLTAAKKLKASHPDVILERRLLADVDKEDPSGGQAVFEILVDGKVVVGHIKSRAARQKLSVEGASQTPSSIFISMEELDLAISRARRKRRPANTVYGEVHGPTEMSLRLDAMLQKD